MNILFDTDSQAHVFMAEPGNGTRYQIVLGYTVTGEPFVAIPNFGKAAVMDPYPIEAGYVGQKLGLNEADATAVFDAIKEWRRQRLATAAS